MSLALFNHAITPRYIADPVAVVPIDATVLPQFWSAAEPMIAAALPYARNRWTVPGIKADLESGDKRLWGVFSDCRLICAIVTVNTDFETVRVCTILICGGAGVDTWVNAALDEIEAAASADGCAQVEIIGRPGWRRKCAGYDHAGEWLVKEIVSRETIGARSL